MQSFSPARVLPTLGCARVSGESTLGSLCRRLARQASAHSMGESVNREKGAAILAQIFIGKLESFGVLLISLLLFASSSCTRFKSPALKLALSLMSRVIQGSLEDMCRSLHPA
uniref:Uncharacterized protein n=1 Tax=Polytomella parva TaxID=51329 RepID=A0A7S0UQQ6_9CHLO|mmetsp:Transcript_14755/g.25988  ORF Transcript_14755/g.25988 Transcript_14755/m.25988 type:complete len:113 (+) Transcript_14755:992-1330(+)